MHGSKKRAGWLGWIVAAAVALAACGGGDNEPVADATPEASASDRADGATGADVADASDAGGAVTGPLISILSFDQGFITLDPDTATVRRLVLDDIGFTDREQPAVVDGDVAWVLGYTPVADQSFTNDVALARVDLGAGTGEAFVDLGRDRADDDDPDSVSWTIVGVMGDTVWLTERVFADTSFALVGYDVTSGTETARHLFDGDGAPRHPIVVGGSMLAQANGDIVRIDPASGEVDVVVSFFDSVSLGDVIAPDELAAYVVTADGAPPDPGDLDGIGRVGEPSPTGGWVTDGTALWWVFDGVRTLERGTNALYGGVVRFDPATAAFTGAWPLGDRYGTFLDDSTSSSMAQAELVVRDGIVWLADGRDDGELVRLDPATGAVTGTLPERAPEVDYTRLEMIDTDPDAVWVRVTRFVITSSGDEGTSATGTSTIERIDAATGETAVAVSEAEIG